MINAKRICFAILTMLLAGCTGTNPQSEKSALAATSALPPGPDVRVKITEEYARHVGRDVYFWAWPMVNMRNRRAASEQLHEIVIAEPLPAAPPNRLGMLTDYIAPDQRVVACPNQDVVYGGGTLALDLSPVVIQVPDFGRRFWLYQVVDCRTDGFAQLGTMHGTKPGFYLLVGPNWNGNVPRGIVSVFRATTSTGLVGPRVFMDDTDEDRKAIQPVLQQIMMYPLSEYDGMMKSKDWNTVPHLPNPSKGEQEIRWVRPETFVDDLPGALADAPAMPGEEARYAQVLAVLKAAKGSPKLKEAMTSGAKEADEQLVNPVFQFRNFGQELPHHWSTIANGAAFGTDYFTRTATAKSNILVNIPEQAKYFYQDLDANGGRLNRHLRSTAFGH